MPLRLRGEATLGASTRPFAGGQGGGGHHWDNGEGDSLDGMMTGGETNSGTETGTVTEAVAGTVGGGGAGGGQCRK